MVDDKEIIKNKTFLKNVILYCQFRQDWVNSKMQF